MTMTGHTGVARLQSRFDDGAALRIGGAKPGVGRSLAGATPILRAPYRP